MTTKREQEMQFIMAHAVAKIGTSPVRYALVTDDKAMSIVGPMRSNKKAAYVAGRKHVLGW